MRNRLIVAAVLVIGAVTFVSNLGTTNVHAAASKPAYTADGKLVLPKGYR